MIPKPAVVLVLCAGALVSALAFARPAQTSEDAPAKTRLGTFRRTDILVAYYRSEAHARSIRELMRRRDEARARGDSAAARAIEAEGAASQDRAHQQLAGREPIPEVLSALEPGLAEVARETGVAAIVSEVHYRADSVEVVDVTEALARRLAPAGR